MVGLLACRYLRLEVRDWLEALVMEQRMGLSSYLPGYRHYLAGGIAVEVEEVADMRHCGVKEILLRKTPHIRTFPFRLGPF